MALFGMHKPSSVGATCSNSGVGSLQRKFRQIIQSDGANDLETLCADFVHRIIRSVPPGIIEIYDVDRRNPNRIQRRVIVNQIPVEVAEVFSKLQRFSRGKDIARQRGR